MYNAVIYVKEYATSFNQDLSKWCVSKIRSVPNNFVVNTTNWTLPKPS